MRIGGDVNSPLVQIVKILCFPRSFGELSKCTKRIFLKSWLWKDRQICDHCQLYTSLLYFLCRVKYSNIEIFAPLNLPADNERSQGELHFDVFSINRPRSCSNLQMANSQKFVEKNNINVFSKWNVWSKIYNLLISIYHQNKSKKS